MKWLVGIAVEKLIKVIIAMITDLFFQWKNKDKIRKKIKEIGNDQDPRRRASDINDILS